MHELQSFINECRSKHLSDEQISQLLLASGWSEAQIRAALLGITAPVPAAAPAPAAPVPVPAVEAPQPHRAGKSSLSSLEAALHHVLLWLFVFSANVVISVVSATLFGQDASAGALTTYLAVIIVTFVPYLIFYLHYLRLQKRQHDLVTSRVWSIITIVFHSIGLSGTIITILITVLNDHNGSRAPIVAASSAIALIDAAVIVTYVAANFIRANAPARPLILRIYPAVLVVILAIFGIAALTRLGPLRADAATRQRLVSTVQAIQSYTKTQGRLPSSLNQINTNTAGISYHIESFNKYQLCASFRASSNAGSTYSGTANDITDDYVDSYEFSYTPKGQQCFTIDAESISAASASGNQSYQSTNQTPSFQFQ